ncbi:MAG: WD40 repeat domain-containing protein [Sulfurimonas sp.]|jgi:hypothetical protein
MPKISECQNNLSDVTELKILDNNLVAYSTKNHGIKIISSEDCSTKLSINNVHELFHPNTFSTSFSPNGAFLAFCVTTQIYIIHIASSIVIKIINCDNEEIEILSFDLESKYIIAGTACGRVLQYRYDGSSLLGRLCSFKKSNQNYDLSFISAIAFYKNRLACASHNGDIFIIDIHSRLSKTSLTNSFIRVNALCFLDETTLISGNADGTLFINYLEDEKKSKQISTGFKTICKIIRMPNPNYIMISGDANYVSLYDIKNNKIVHNKYLEFKGKVTKIALTNNTTLLAVIDNLNIVQVQLPSVAKLKSLILHNKLDAAFHLCEKDCMIKESLEYKKLQESYDKIYEQAVEFLVNQQKTEAIKLLETFKNIPSKKDEIALLFKSFEHYPRLQEFFLEKKYALAYALCAKFPALERTSQYKKMEELWREAFINAQKQILLGRDEIAKSLLLEYVTILSKRPMIRLILNHNKEFIEFLKAVEAKNFLKVNEIVKTNEAFTKIPTYKLLENDIEYGLLEIKDFIKKGDTDAAKENLVKFEGLASVTTEIKKLTQEYQNMHKLQKAYKDGNLIVCYEILDTQNNLSYTKLAESLEKKWSELIHICEEYALRGNIKDIKVTLGGLIYLSTRRDKIGDLLRVSFHTKIKILMTKKSFKNAENIIYSYIDIFGTDMEINSLIRLYENVTNTRLAISDNSRQTRDNWINFEMIMNS